MPTYQDIGDKEALSKRGVPSPTDNARQGKVQMVGDSQAMSRKAIPSPTEHGPMGTIQHVGDSVTMSRKPVHGWGSTPQAGLDNSPVAVSAAANSSAAKGRGKKR